MNENDFSAAFDAEDAFASRMDYMRRKRRRRRRRREGEKEEEEEEEKVRRQDCRTDKKMQRQRASEPRRICFVLDGTQKITRNSRSQFGQGLVKYWSRFEAFARSANAYRVESRKPAKQVRLPIIKREE